MITLFTLLVGLLFGGIEFMLVMYVAKQQTINIQNPIEKMTTICFWMFIASMFSIVAGITTAIGFLQTIE